MVIAAPKAAKIFLNDQKRSIVLRRTFQHIYLIRRNAIAFPLRVSLWAKTRALHHVAN
jgi:hypothetical protein